MKFLARRADLRNFQPDLLQHCLKFLRLPRGFRPSFLRQEIKYLDYILCLLLQLEAGCHADCPQPLLRS